MRKIKINLEQILKERDMKQSKLAEISDVRPNAISNLCRGYVDRLSIEHLEKICNALKIELHELIELENED